MRIISQYILSTVIAATMVLSASAQKAKVPTDDRGYLVKVGDQAPDDFTLQLTDGKSVQLKDLRGKVVVLQFTASWCEVCREEMPHLEKDLWQVYKDKGVFLIAVDRDQPMDTVKNFKKTMGMTYPFALDPGADIFGRFADKGAGVTRNVVIDQNGKIAFMTRLYTPEEFNKMLGVIQNLTKS
jgi:peroxiredoxin